MEKLVTYSVDPAIFEQFPGYQRGVVFCKGVSNNENQEVTSLLRQVEQGVQEQLRDVQINELDTVASWREAYRKFGAKPSQFRSSVEAMLRRVQKGNQLPAINTLVDLGNIISIKYQLSAGGHALDEVEKPLQLRYANGSETFTPFGTDLQENPEPGEIIFVEGDVVLTRRWTWRQANHTITLPETRIIEFNVDCLPPYPEEKLMPICKELRDLVQKYCGGESEILVLNEKNPEIRLSL